MASVVPKEDVAEAGGPKAEASPSPDGPAPERVEMPLPSDLRTAFEGGLFLLASLAALYATREIVLPVILALVLRLVLQPAVRLLERFRLPTALSALLLIAVLLGAVVTLGTALYGPASSWAAKLPEGIPRLQDHLRFLRTPIEAVHNFLQLAEGYVTGEAKQTPSGAAPMATEGAVWITLFAGSRDFVAGLLEMVLVLFFLLLGADTFLRRLVEILPGYSEKRQAVEMMLHIEQDISAYLVTVTIMNAVVGFATTLAMWVCGVSDPILWGAVAFLLNYVPILGPMLGIVTFILVGLLTAENFWLALLPAALYLAIHLIEGETITPLLLSRRFTLNPVFVILSLIFWYWMWGVLGAILAVPMLAVTKIVCDRVRTLAAIGHFLEG